MDHGTTLGCGSLERRNPSGSLRVASVKELFTTKGEVKDVRMPLDDATKAPVDTRGHSMWLVAKALLMMLGLV